MATLEQERAERRRFESELAQLRQTTMSDAEKAVAAARAEGKAEAEKTANLKVAAAEFRARAAGKIANIEAAIGVLDLSKLLDKDGNPDTKAIDALVAQLAAVPQAAPPPGHVPPGARPDANGGVADDWLRRVQRGPRR
jgi:hypothetical protein